MSHHPDTADVAASETAVLAGQLTLLETVMLIQRLTSLTSQLASVCKNRG